MSDADYDIEYSNPLLHKTKPTSIKTCTFDEMREHVSKLNELLKDPQLGLFTWCEMYSEHMKCISDYWVNN
jgi:hypothetical protein